MKITVIFIATLLLFYTSLCGQTRTIQGRVISEELEPLYGVHIKNKGTVLFGKTDINGRFKIEISQNTEVLFLSWVGFERTNIKFKNDCDTLEIIMLYASTYDFMSPKKIDRLRLERFNKLPALYLQAYDKGLFSKKAICYLNEFEANKPRLDEIQREMIKKKAEIKKTFEKLNIGDTIKIPFSEQYRYDGTDKTTLIAYSAFSEYTTYKCVIKGVVFDKNKNHNGYNLLYRVINCDKCKLLPVYNGRTMKPDEVFEHNMRYFKVLID